MGPALIEGVGITVTTIVSITAKHGALGLAVNKRRTVSDVMIGEYVLVKELVLLNEPEDEDHTTEV